MLYDFTLFTLIAVDNKERCIVLSCTTMHIILIITLMEVIRKHLTNDSVVYNTDCFMLNCSYVAAYACTS